MSAETAVIDPPATAAPAEPKLPLFSQPPSEPKPAPKDDEGVRLSRSEYDAFLTLKADAERLKAEEKQKQREAEDRAIKRDIEDKNAKQLMERLAAKEKEDNERRDREYAEKLENDRRLAAIELKRVADEKAAAENRARSIEQKVKKSTLDRDLAQALSRPDLVSGGAKQLAALWANEFTVVEDGDSYTSRSNDGMSVADFVAARLAQPEYSHFIKAGSTRGGTVTGPAISHVQQEQPAGPDFSKLNMGQAIVEWGKGVQKAQGDARANMSLGFGLRGAH